MTVSPTTRSPTPEPTMSGAPGPSGMPGALAGHEGHAGRRTLRPVLGGVEPGSFSHVLSGVSPRLAHPASRSTPAPHGTLAAGASSPSGADLSDLDSAARHAAQLAPPSQPNPPAGPVVAFAPPSPPPPSPPPTMAAAVRATVEDLMDPRMGLVRRIAWSGDGRRGAVRIEVGAGELAGAAFLVQADRGRVRVTLEAPPGSTDQDMEGWRARIAARFDARGLDVDALEIR